MAVIPALPPVFVDGQVPTAAQLNGLASSLNGVTAQLAYISADGDYLVRKPQTKTVLVATGLNPITTATTTAVHWDQAVYDTEHMLALQSDTQFIAWKPGWYRIEAQVAFDIAASSERRVSICVNGTADANVTASASTRIGANNYERVQVASLEHLSSAASVYLTVWQDSGGTVALLPSQNWGAWMSIIYEGPY